jgi:ribosomal protein S18 acetylase RimI-like enzyme
VTDELGALSFRPLRAEDIEDLFLPDECAIAQEWLARQERGELYVAVAEVDGEAVARRCLDYTCSAEVGAAYCFAASVMGDLRSRGIGTALDRHFEEVALARGFHTLQCVSVKSNLRALSWHERLGYRRVGEDVIRWQEPDGEREFECWLMERPLGPG